MKVKWSFDVEQNEFSSNSKEKSEREKKKWECENGSKEREKKLRDFGKLFCSLFIFWKIVNIYLLKFNWAVVNVGSIGSIMVNILFKFKFTIIKC